MKMNVWMYYIGELVRAQLEDRKPAPIPSDINLDVLIEFSIKNHMNYLLMGALLQTDASEEHKEKLRYYVKNSTMRTVMQVMEIKEIQRRFEAEGIRHQFMKGSCMKFMYPTPQMREMSDMDVLIHDESMNKASFVLKEMGYELIQSVKHHDIYRKGKYMVVEAHKAMYDKTIDKNQYEYFADFSKRKVKPDFQYAMEFTKEDFYVYMMSHMAKHFYQMGCGIRNLLDIYIYRQQFFDQMDMEYMRGELKALGLNDFANHMETLCDIWMQGTPCTKFYENLFMYMLDCGIYGKDENGIWNQFAKEKNSDLSNYKAKLKIWYFFPPLHYMAEYYSFLEDYPVLLPIAWLIRGFGGVFGHKGTYKRKMIHEIDKQKIGVVQELYREMNFEFHK